MPSRKWSSKKAAKIEARKAEAQAEADAINQKYMQRRAIVDVGEDGFPRIRLLVRGSYPAEKQE